MSAPQPHPTDSDAASRVHHLIQHATDLYDHKRYRQALALCDEVARLDPTAALPEIMRGECVRALRRRRRRRATLAAMGGMVLIGVWFVHRQLSRIRVRPAPGALVLAEKETQHFAFVSGFGRHKDLEFTWALLDEHRQPAPTAEQGCLKQERNTPWSCTYEPAYAVVRAATGQASVTRRVVATAANSAGAQLLHAEWPITVDNVPMPPQLVSVEPLPDERAAVAPGGARTFRVQASDGDGGTHLTYEWLAGEEGRIVGGKPTWTYRRPPRAAPPHHGSPSPAPQETKLVVVCRVSNRFGPPLTHTLTWLVHLVPSNRPPEIVAVEPHCPNTIALEPDKPLRLVASVHDPDKHDVARCRWELDGRLVSVRDHYTLIPPLDAAHPNKQHLLRLTVRDSCGATAQRAWQVLPPEK